MKPEDISAEITYKALELGASLVGFADVNQVRTSPSHKIFNIIGMMEGDVGSREIEENFQIKWPPKAPTVVVIAVSHPQDKPEMDWWCGRSTSGNDILIRVNRELSEWIETELGIQTHPLAYHIEKGGIFLKDSAVMAGLGCIGKNNMVVTPKYGPRVRLRAMLIEKKLPATGPIDFNPCDTCEEFCRKACPQRAFDKITYSSKTIGFSELPGRSGCFDRIECGREMSENLNTTDDGGKDEGGWTTGTDGKEPEPVKFCRACEFACPVGLSTGQ